MGPEGGHGQQLGGGCACIPRPCCIDIADDAGLGLDGFHELPGRDHGVVAHAFLTEGSARVGHVRSLAPRGVLPDSSGGRGRGGGGGALAHEEEYYPGRPGAAAAALVLGDMVDGRVERRVQALGVADDAPPLLNPLGVPGLEAAGNSRLLPERLLHVPHELAPARVVLRDALPLGRRRRARPSSVALDFVGLCLLGLAVAARSDAAPQLEGGRLGHVEAEDFAHLAQRA